MSIPTCADVKETPELRDWIYTDVLAIERPLCK